MKKRTLILGASLKKERYSNLAIQSLVKHNHEVVAVGLKTGSVAGVPIQTSIEGIKDIDTISLYLHPSKQESYYNFIIELSPRRLIFNPGTENNAVYAMFEKNGIQVEEACTLVLLSTNQY
ncbi:CoA-binding protein [Aquimarina algicola]|uniref:CoA-binding protein n=1 Tax=Aquimarina algicola TaxID=2589995 RepID=A0A504JC23_9FLAO|nr:CoA-binding protein [Aquimarina algicola]TPN85418.1 CoA-binding protein [Aquimarina algicola]